MATAAQRYSFRNSEPAALVGILPESLAGSRRTSFLRSPQHLHTLNLDWTHRYRSHRYNLSICFHLMLVTVYPRRLGSSSALFETQFPLDGFWFQVSRVGFSVAPSSRIWLTNCKWRIRQWVVDSSPSWRNNSLQQTWTLEPECLLF